LCGTTSGFANVKRIASPALTVGWAFEKVRFLPASMALERGLDTMILVYSLLQEAQSR
jgi:hypothetical protein